MQRSGGRRWLWIGVALTLLVVVGLGMLLVSTSLRPSPSAVERTPGTQAAAATDQTVTLTQTALEVPDATSPPPTQTPPRIDVLPTAQATATSGLSLRTSEPTFEPTEHPAGEDETPTALVQNTAQTDEPVAAEDEPTATEFSEGEGGGEPTETGGDMGDEPTLPLITESPVPVEVAAASFIVRDVSGGVIGEGTLRVFAPDKVQTSQTARVELELRIDTGYITPTPIPLDSSPGIPRDGARRTSTPRAGRPTATPREPTFEESGIDVYQRMGVSLICAESSFLGCNKDRPDPIEARIVTIEGMRWSWILTPQEGARGFQDLELRLWKLISVNDAPPEPEIVWTHGFRIEVTPGAASGGGVPVTAIVGVAVVALAAVIGVAFVTRRGKGTPALPLIPGNRPTVFISYRRRSTFADAWFVSQELQKAGADVFLDIEDIHEGQFAEKIETAIRERTFFVPVLAPDTLDSDWVRKEIALAIQHKKRIVPVLVRGFTLDALPDDVKELGTYNAVTITPEFIRAAIDKLLRFMDLQG